MSKPRICKTCKWLRHRVEPCCSCSRWGKGKTDHYIPAEETLGEYLQRKEREKMEKEKNIENLSTDELIKTFELCINADECMQCPFKWEEDYVDKLSAEALNRLKQLQQELIDERNRYDRLVSFELDEAEILRAAKGFVGACVNRVFFTDKANETEKIGVFQLIKADCPSSVTCGDSFSPEGRSLSGENIAEQDDTVRRCAEYIAEKRLQMDDEPSEVGCGYYWRNICGINAQQEAKGIAKYGQSLEANATLSTEQRIEHAQEELIDALKYLEHLKAVAGDKLTANDYQRMAMRTAGEYETNYDQLRNAAYGLNGEAGEVIDLLKKHEFQGHDLPDEKLIDECGDVLWYCALLADALGFSLEQVMNRNIDKLRKRYPDGFDKNRSINREG